MTHKKQLDKIGATPGKLALMGVLALALVVVIVKQLPKGAADDLGTVAAASQQAATQQASSANPSASPETQKELPPWPEISLTETFASDPFAPPAWVDQEEPAAPVADKGPDRLAELQKQGASIVVIADGRKSARIGEEKFGVGDILDGYQVSDITTQGILLNKLDSH